MNCLNVGWNIFIGTLLSLSPLSLRGLFTISILLHWKVEHVKSFSSLWWQKHSCLWAVFLSKPGTESAIFWCTPLGCCSFSLPPLFLHWFLFDNLHSQIFPTEGLILTASVHFSSSRFATWHDRPLRHSRWSAGAYYRWSIHNKHILVLCYSTWPTSGPMIHLCAHLIYLLCYICQNNISRHLKCDLDLTMKKPL